MTARVIIARLWAQRRGRVGLALLGVLVLAALGADCLASDLPIVTRFDGQTFVLPAWTRPAALRSLDNQRLERDPRQTFLWRPLCRYGPEQQPQILRPPPAPPDGEHWLGTDDRGRDLFARLVHGTRTSLIIGFGAAMCAGLIGLALGLLAGYYRGLVDALISRLIEVALSFPMLLLVLAVMALLDRTSVGSVVIVLGLTTWADLARLVRAEVLRLRELDFVLAARGLGAGNGRILVEHVLPNALTPVLVHTAFAVAAAMLIESALAFLGFGVPPPTASWGEILGQATQHSQAWWMVLPPGLALFATVIGLNLLAEALQAALDPRQQSQPATVISSRS